MKQVTVENKFNHSYRLIMFKRACFYQRLKGAWHNSLNSVSFRKQQQLLLVRCFVAMKKTDEDPKEAFQRIVRRADALGVPPEKLAKLPVVQELQAPRMLWMKQWMRYALITCILLQVSLLTIWWTEWPVNREGLIHWWFNAQSLDAEREPCLVELTESILDVTRPPVDCDICRGISEADRVAGLSQKDFEEKYAYSGRPVVITDGMKTWTAPKTFSFDFFKGIYSEDSPALYNMEMNCQFFPYKTSFMSLGEVFNMSDERAQMKEGAEPWYIGW